MEKQIIDGLWPRSAVGPVMTGGVWAVSWSPARLEATAPSLPYISLTGGPDPQLEVEVWPRRDPARQSAFGLRIRE